MGLAVTAALAWATAPLLSLSLGETAILAAAISTTVILSCGAAWLKLGKLEKQFYNGRDVPPRNLPEKKRSN
jgi:hypothetical protein